MPEGTAGEIGYLDNSQLVTVNEFTIWIRKKKKKDREYFY